MPGFAEKMRLKEMAEEDIYFAQRDRELIEALRRKKAQRDGAEGQEMDKDQDSEKSADSSSHT